MLLLNIKAYEKHYSYTYQYFTGMRSCQTTDGFQLQWKAARTENPETETENEWKKMFGIGVPADAPKS